MVYNKVLYKDTNIPIINYNKNNILILITLLMRYILSTEVLSGKIIGISS